MNNNARIAWTSWAVFALVVVIVKFNVAPSDGNVFHIYREAAVRWSQGQDIYPAHLYFNYFPSAAIFFLPWTWIPFEIGGAIWRAANLFLFAFGLFRLSQTLETSFPRIRENFYFAIATFFTITMSWSAARYGQMTLAMAGLMMLSVAHVQRGEYWRAALFIAASVALKPPAIVLMLILVVLCPGMRIPTLVFLLAFGLAPFLFQSASYVIEQYRGIPEMLQARAARIWPYPHVFGLLDSVGLRSDPALRLIARVAASVVVLGACWQVLRARTSPGAPFYLYTLAAAYILLFGEGTEHNTYALMAPTLGLAMAVAYEALHWSAITALAASWLLTVFSNTLMNMSPDVAFMAMLKPLACCLLIAVVITGVLRQLREPQLFP